MKFFYREDNFPRSVNSFGGTCLGGTVLLLNGVQQMFHECNHEGWCDVFWALCLTISTCIRKRSRETLGKTSRELLDPCALEDLEHK